MASLGRLDCFEVPSFQQPCCEGVSRVLGGTGFREAEWNSFLRVDSRGDHHGFVFEDGWYNGVCSFRREASVLKCLSNHASRARQVGKVGGERTELSFKRGFREGQSVLDQLGLGGGGARIGWERRIVTGTWFEPVDGRGVSHDLKKRVRDGVAKARSRTEGLPIPVGGKWVYTPGIFSMVYPRSAAREK